MEHFSNQNMRLTITSVLLVITKQCRYTLWRLCESVFHGLYPFSQGRLTLKYNYKVTKKFSERKRAHVGNESTIPTLKYNYIYTGLPKLALQSVNKDHCCTVDYQQLLISKSRAPLSSTGQFEWFASRENLHTWRTRSRCCQKQCAWLPPPFSGSRSRRHALLPW